MTRLLDNLPDNNIRALTLSMPLRHNGRASALQRATFSIIASSNVLQSGSGTLADDGVSWGAMINICRFYTAKCSEGSSPGVWPGIEQQISASPTCTGNDGSDR